MKKISGLLLLVTHIYLYGQKPLLRPGSRFPDIVINHITNAPVKEFYLNKAEDNKFYILNFWGTWCTPCIPEMDILSELQKANAGKLQVIAISDDNEERKANYLRKKPSSVWLATDTNYTLYHMLNLDYVGQSAIIGPDKKIVTVVRTDSINQQMVDRLLRGDRIQMSAGIKEEFMQTGNDVFDVDSLTDHSFTIRGYKKGRQRMGQTYPNGPYQGRRLTWFNVSPGLLYRAAYGIKSYGNQELYDSMVNERDVNTRDITQTQALYCVDLLVQPQQKDSLYLILREYLNRFLPVKARAGKKKMQVYVLKQKTGATLAIRSSVAEKTIYSFSGRGYEGQKVTLAEFATDYLTNELNLPVVNETGLQGFYDIITKVELRDVENIKKSIEALGLIIEKTEREVDIIIYYK
jgi:uncharacterized protein (TIGR03435 family)